MLPFRFFLQHTKPFARDALELLDESLVSHAKEIQGVIVNTFDALVNHERIAGIEYSLRAVAKARDDAQTGCGRVLPDFLTRPLVTDRSSFDDT